jgi:AAA15 family ATPase/GTPase
MFQSLSVTNFRGFKELKVQGLDRMNLFLGKNNVGKSALLESIFLLAAPMNAELPLRLHGFRGIEQLRGDVEAIWGWLFYEKDVTKRISLELVEADSLRRRTLKMRIAERKDSQSGRKRAQTQKMKPSLGTTSKSDIPTELLLEYQTERGAKGDARAFIKEDGIAYEHGKVSAFATSVFVTSRGGYSPENAQRFSKLQELMREQDIIPALQLVEPRIKKLSVLVSGIGPMIHGDIGIGRMVPVPMMGEGIGRLLTILLSIYESKDGLVMVDEIDTGFHYSILRDVWTAIAKVAREVNTQVFATTHSWECLKAAHESFSLSDSYDFRLHRLDRRAQDDLITSTKYDKEMIDTALSSGMELR